VFEPRWHAIVDEDCSRTAWIADHWVGRELRRDPLGALERARREHGDVVRLVLGQGLTRHALFHPDALRRVLASEADGYRKDSRVGDEVRWAVGEGLLTSQDERWLRQRRLIQPLFTRRRIAGYADSMAAEAGDVVERWRRPVADRQSVDVHAEMSRLTLRVVGRLLFGGTWSLCCWSRRGRSRCSAIACAAAASRRRGFRGRGRRRSTGACAARNGPCMGCATS
jgi:cytochrome P450